MLSSKQNFLETIRRGGKPDRLVRQFEGTAFVPGDPVNYYVRGDRYPGMATKKDLWGTTIVWEQDSPGAMPHVTNENKAVKDITRWRDFTSVPDLPLHCSDKALWEPYLERIGQIDRDENLIMMFAPTGIFERLHFLMGFEDALINLRAEPEAMEDLCAAIGEYRYNGMKLMVERARPDIILSHDDWGSKTQLFMSPKLWRRFIKANYQRTYDYLHSEGVIIMHHSDSFLEPLAEDMIDLHIDIWQGVLPQNDIPKLQEQIDGRMTLMGGLDASVIDRVNSTEQEIRAETRRACAEYSPGGNFIPCITYGGPGCIYPHVDAIIDDEIYRFNLETAGEKE
jgi:hypothetical protein